MNEGPHEEPEQVNEQWAGVGVGGSMAAAFSTFSQTGVVPHASLLKNLPTNANAYANKTTHTRLHPACQFCLT